MSSTISVYEVTCHSLCLIHFDVTCHSLMYMPMASLAIAYVVLRGLLSYSLSLIIWGPLS